MERKDRDREAHRRMGHFRLLQLYECADTHAHAWLHLKVDPGMHRRVHALSMVLRDCSKIVAWGWLLQGMPRLSGCWCVLHVLSGTEDTPLGTRQQWVAAHLTCC
mmetsp:Transcript_6384/g.17018  ORF Transcript_6384/g.17018 Transcript_6384/m.17018 type:complete len:105 (+) Transcript_6384:862-1176(+)